MLILMARLIALLLACSLALVPLEAAADSWKSTKAKSKGKYEEHYRAGDCTYKIKGNAKGHSKKVKCRRGASFGGGPPPWAPAHGYRTNKKKKDRHYTREPYVPPFDLSIGKCNRAALGAAIGGGTGAVLGSQIGSGDGRTAAIIGGTILGVLVGGSIGQAMDNIDQNCVGQVLEHAPDGQDIIWTDAQSNQQYRVAPVQTIQTEDGQYCREYTATSTVSGQEQGTYGTACRQPDGAWKIRS